MFYFENMAGNVMTNVLGGDLFKRTLSSVIERGKRDPAFRRVLLRVVWAISVVVMIVFTALLIFGSYKITQSYKIGIFASGVFWALFLGITALLFLPSKAIIAAFGFLLGTGLSEAGNSSGLISKINELIAKIAGEVGTIVPDTNGQNKAFIAMLVWIFVIIIGLLCLPAFFAKEESTNAGSIQSSVQPGH